MKRLTLIVTLLCFFLFFFCTDRKCETRPDTSAIEVKVKVERLESHLSKIKSRTELKAFLLNNRDLARVFSYDEYPNDSIFIDEFYKRISDPYVDTIFQDVENVFGDFSDLKSQFEDAFKIVKYYYPKFLVPQIKTVASGFFSPDFYFTDSTIYIALDYFTGPKGHYFPPEQPQYIVDRYRKEYIIPTVARIISSQFNATDEKDKSMMADIIYWGKSYYFVNKILPCTNDSLIIGYSEKELERAAKNQERIFAHFVEKQLLYETSHFIKTKYIGDRPYTAEISSKCPGRIGQWLGWKIVNKYMEEMDKEYPLQALMGIKNSNTLFTKSKFKPKDGEGL